MKVFLVIPDLSQGGAERVMSELANNLAKSGHEVHLVLLVDTLDFYRIESEVVVHRLGFLNKGRIQKKMSEISTFIKLRKLLKSYRPDTVLSFMDKYNVFTILASSFLGLNVFVSDRSNPKLENSYILRIFKKLTYKKATGIIAQTSMAKDLIYKFTGNENIHVVPNPLKNIILDPTVARENIILNVGRLVPEKGQSLLLNAFARLNHPNWKLVIVGGGPLLGELEDHAKNLEVIDKVTFTGSVSNVDQWYAKASIFAFSSISEGFPNALIEAMAAGLPCVSFDCDAGPRDIIDNGKNGILVPVGEYELLADSLNHLIRNEEFRDLLSAEGAKVRNKLSADIICQKYLKAISLKS